MKGLWQLALVIALILFVPALVYGPAYLRHRQEARIRAEGQPATAVVVRLEDTGNRRNSMPEMIIHMQVSAEGRPPWEASLRRVVSMVDLAAFSPGRTFAVRYDPARPERIALAQ